VTARKLSAIALIFVGASLAWSVLGSSVSIRTGEYDAALERDVRLLWGAPHHQVAPHVCVERTDIDSTFEEKVVEGRLVRREVKVRRDHCDAIGLDSTQADVNLRLEHRKKGLLWYPTYDVGFKSTYSFRNPDLEERVLVVRFPLPSENAFFDGFVFKINGVDVPRSSDMSKEVSGSVSAAAGAVETLDVQYQSRGLQTWTYAFAPTGTAEVKDFRLTLDTNFPDIDFPAGAVSPGEKRRTTEGVVLDWRFANLITGQNIGLALPEKLNPGPFARVTYFAPVSLLFFLTVMVIVGATHGPSLHPMHYWFIACAFFAFHLLLAYLVDHISVHLAFASAAAVSLALVFSYLRVVTGAGRALWWAVSAQAVFLVLFGYAFFFEGFTGLTITIGAIVTLFVLMQVTARVSWDDIFSAGRLDHATRV
jgi:inner membrane protein involved in colicin E2 resistance